MPYNVLLAEDELFVRLGIKNSVPWEQYDMNIVYAAENGQVAWEKILEFNPHILITDLRMPILDGIELINKIHENHINCYIIVITCLEDFSLLKQLLGLGIRDYILKATMTEDEICLCLNKARNALNASSHASNTAATHFPSTKDTESLGLYNYFYHDLAFEQIASLLPTYEPSSAISPLFLAVGKVDIIFDHSGNHLSETPSNLYQNLSDLLEHNVLVDSPIHYFLLKNNYFILFWVPPQNLASESYFLSAENTFSTLHKKLQDYLQIDTSLVGTYLSFSHLNELKSAYWESQKKLNLTYLYGTGYLQFVWKEHTSDFIDNTCKQLLYHADWIEKYLGLQQKNNYLTYLNTIRSCVAISQEEMTCTFVRFFHYICTLFPVNITYETQQSDRLLIKHPFLPENIQLLDNLLKSCEHHYLKTTVPLKRPEIQLALQMIESNWHKADLSLRTVANHVHLSETYFSSLFHKETGQSFVKYLNQIRIEKAKHILRVTHLKILDIALQTGFSDEAYFSRVFKKSTGLSPSDWRKQ